MGTFIDSTHMKLVPFQRLLEGPMEVVLCERVYDLRHSLFYNIMAEGFRLMRSGLVRLRTFRLSA